MQWIIHGLEHAALGFATAVAQVLGAFLTGVIVQPLLQYLVFPLLQHTLFTPFMLTGPSVVGRTLPVVWGTTVAVSGAVALAALLWGTFLRTAPGLAAGRRWGEIGEGVVLYGFVLVGALPYLGMLLQIGDMVTRTLVASTEAMARALAASNPAAGSLAGGAAALAYFFLPLLLLALSGALLWVVAQWLMRQVDLIVFVGLLPVTAALALAGDRRAFQWNWAEAQGAVLNQLAMAVVWWMAWVILTGGQLHGTFPPPFPHQADAAWTWFLRLFLGLAAFTLVARAPALLGQITGHQHTGMWGLLAGVAGGELLARGMGAALRASTGGQALGALQEGLGGRAQQRLAGWSQHGRSVGERLGGTRAGQWLGQVRAAAGERLAEAGARVGRQVGGVLRSYPAGAAAGAWWEGTPSGQAVARTVAGAARAAGGAAGAAVGAARTAASLAYQPRTTLARLAEGGYQAAGRGRAEQQAVQKAVYRGEAGNEAAVEARYPAAAPNLAVADRDRMAAVTERAQARRAAHGREPLYPVPRGLEAAPPPDPSRRPPARAPGWDTEPPPPGPIQDRLQQRRRQGPNPAGRRRYR